MATRRLPADATPPVIVLTSVALQADGRALLGRASLVLSKSQLSSGMLLEAIDSVLPVGETSNAA